MIIFKQTCVWWKACCLACNAWSYKLLRSVKARQRQHAVMMRLTRLIIGVPACDNLDQTEFDALFAGHFMAMC